MRTIGLAFKDVESGFDADALSDSVLNADGSPASLCETELTLICITGIEDPLREQAQFCCASALGRVKDEK